MPPRIRASRSGQLCKVSDEADQRVRSSLPVVHSLAGTHANACDEPETVNVKSPAPLRTDKGSLREYQCIPGGRCNPTSCANGGSTLGEAVGNPSNGISPTASPGCGAIESEHSSDTCRVPKAAIDPAVVRDVGPSPPRATPPSTRHSRPCRSAPSDAHRPGAPDQLGRPTPAPGPALRPTQDSGRRRPPTSDQECERVASQRCPSGLRFWNRRKSQSPSTAWHLVVTARSHHHSHRWIEAYTSQQIPWAPILGAAARPVASTQRCPVFWPLQVLSQTSGRKDADDQRRPYLR